MTERLEELNEELEQKIGLNTGDDGDDKKKYIKEVFYPERRRNFCKHYRLEDEIKEKTFNDKYNRPEYVHVFYKRNDFTEAFLKAIKTRIRNETNIIIVIFGEPHSGKSEVAQAISFHIRKSFLELLELKINIHICFSTAEFDKILRIMGRGDVGLRDESPRISGTGARTIKGNLDNIVEIVRAHQNSFLFVSPRRIEASIVTYYLEMAGKDVDNRTCRCILYDPSFKDGQEPIGRIFIELHNDKKFRNEYQERKNENIKKMLKTAGQQTVGFNEELFDRDLKGLLEHCKRYKLKSKRSIESQIQIYNRRFEKEEDKIQGSGNYIDTLVDEAFLILNNKKKMKLEEKKENKKEEEKVDELGLFKKFSFDHSEEEILEKVKKESNFKNPKRDFKVYQLREEENVLIEDVLEKFKDLKAKSAISNIVRKIRSKKAYVKGKLFEKEYFEYLQKLKIYDKVIWDGAPGKPDIVAYFERNQGIHFFSLKTFTYEDTNYIMNKKHILPELKSALESLINHKEVKLYLVVLDCVNNRVNVVDYDFKNPKNVRIF